MATTAAAMKECSKCGEAKPLADFPPRKSSRDGKHGWCRPCYRAYYSAASRTWRAQNRGRQREAARRQYHADPERHRAYKRRYDEANREAVNARAREAYATNGGREYAREYRRLHPEATKAASRRWYRRNREKVLDDFHARRQAERQGIVTLARLGHLLASPCLYCGATERIEIDHVVPLSRGGKHEDANLAPACRRCNASKGNKLLSEWTGA